MINKKQFPPETYLYQNNDCIELNKIIPSFQHGVYSKNKFYKEKLFKDLDLDIPLVPKNQPKNKSLRFDTMTQGVVFKYWKELKKRG